MTHFLRTLAVVALCAALAPAVAAQRNDLLYNNGPLFNSPGTATNGGDESILQTGPPLNLLPIDYNADAEGNNEMADDFTVPAGETWAIKAFTFYAYERALLTTPTITAASPILYPDAGGAPDTANPITGGACPDGSSITANATMTDVYRVTDTMSGTNGRRRLQEIDIDLGGDCMLTEGTYWVAVQFAGDVSLPGPKQPPVPQPLGATECQALNGSTAHEDLNDSGFSPVQNGPCDVDIPFEILGSSISLSCPFTISDASISPLAVAAGDTISLSAFIGNIDSVRRDARGLLYFERVNGPQMGNLRLFGRSIPAGGFFLSQQQVVNSQPNVGFYDVWLRIFEVPSGEMCDEAGPFRIEILPASSAAAAAVAAPETQVSPNPFADETQIAFTTDASADVRLAVYDVLGREVAVLVDGMLEAGAHRATFQARDLAAGTYVWRLSVGEEVQTGQLTLTR